MRRYLPILIFTVFSLNNFVSSLKCKCTARGDTGINALRGSMPLPQGPPCSSDGVCTIDIDRGVCGIEMVAGETVQFCAWSDLPLIGCKKESSTRANDSSQCTCTDKDFCNEKMGQTDFGKRPGPTIKCKCSPPGIDGCDLYGTCMTPGICASMNTSIDGITQVEYSCSERGPRKVGCSQINTDKVKKVPVVRMRSSAPGGAEGASKGPGGDGGTATKGPAGDKGSKGNAPNCVSHLSVFLVFAPALVLFNPF